MEQCRKEREELEQRYAGPAVLRGEGRCPGAVLAVRHRGVGGGGGGHGMWGGCASPHVPFAAMVEQRTQEDDQVIDHLREMVCPPPLPPNTTALHTPPPCPPKPH